MPLEVATFISDLLPSNPAHTDGLSQADSQMRLIKSTIKATFPNFTAAPLQSNQAQIDAVVTAAPAVALYLVPPGAIVDFAGSTPPTGWITCDGQAIPRTSFPALFAFLGTTWGAGDGSTTFNVPNLSSRFRRHRDNSIFSGAVGNVQGPANLQHSHSVSGSTGTENVAHAHTFGGTTSADYPDHAHVGVITGPGSFDVPGGVNGPIAGNYWAGRTPTFGNTGGATARHQHDYSGTTATESAAHAHTFGVTSGLTGDPNEARPYSATVLACIKA